MAQPGKLRLGTQGLWPSLWLGVAAFALDRVHKYVQIEMLGWQGGEHVTVTGFFNYVLVWNTGISYGFLDKLPVIALIGIMLAATGLLMWWWWRADTVLARIGLAICMGGALSHIIDRLIYRAVPDFFHLHWGGWSFYVFNISDMAITLGVGVLVLDVVLAFKQGKA